MGNGHRQYLPRVSRQEDDDEGNGRDWQRLKRGQATAGALSLIPLRLGNQGSDQELFLRQINKGLDFTCDAKNQIIRVSQMHIRSVYPSININ